MAQFGPMLSTIYAIQRGEFQEFQPRFPFPIPLPVRIRSAPEAWGRVDVLAAFTQRDPINRRRALEKLERRGFQLTTRAGRGAAGSIDIDRLGRLADSDDGIYLEAAALVYPELNDSVPEAWHHPLPPPATGPTGSGVVVGIVDSGVDVTHPSLLYANGHTRILRLWDQGVASGPRPAAYDYGSEWDAAHIGLYFLGSSATLPTVDNNGHGTAVAGIIASNGLGAGGCCAGVASSAELIVVKIDADRGVFSSTANVTDAIRYIFETAEELGKRAVVNLSHGALLGPHDPNGQFEMLITDVIEASAERILVTSAGNLGDAEAHASFQPLQDRNMDLCVDVPKGVGQYVVIEFWSDRADLLHFEVIDPNGDQSSMVAGNWEVYYFANESCEFKRVPNVLGVNADHMQIKIMTGRPHVTPGGWVVRITGARVVSRRPVHAWLDRGLLASPRFQAPDASCTATPPSAARGAIVAGSYRMSPRLGELAQSSGQGPDRAGNSLQFLTAPGEPITSCCPIALSNSRHIRVSGTSFAAAHVTGTVALMLEKQPKLTRDQVMKCLLQSTRTDQDTETGPPAAWGAGKLNIHAALNCCGHTPIHE